MKHILLAATFLGASTAIAFAQRMTGDDIASAAEGGGGFILTIVLVVIVYVILRAFGKSKSNAETGGLTAAASVLILWPIATLVALIPYAILSEILGFEFSLLIPAVIGGAYVAYTVMKS